MAAEDDDDSHIIASVRRILGEDASRPRALHGGGATPPDVYELTPGMMIEPQPAGVPHKAAAPAPEEGELSPDLAAWASEWGDAEEAQASEDVSVVPQAAPMLAAQQEQALPPAVPVRDGEPGHETTSLRAAPPPAPVEAPRETPMPDAAVAPAEDAAPIVEPQTADAAGHAFGSLRDTLRARRDDAAVSALPAPSAIHSHAGGPTIEEMIRQELRPLLKAWLDAQLPELVERVVRAEIARIVEQGGD